MDMDQNLSVKYLVEYCSPTLASLKTANLFNYRYQGEKPEDVIARWDRGLAEKGIRACILRENEDSALIFVYRVSGLQEILSRKSVRCFLSRCGYSCFDIQSVLRVLRQKLSANSAFPHEIGVFLGYPLGDVIGFIRNGGKNCKCVGNWKVYCNESEAVKAFERFRKCRQVYTRLFDQGVSVQRLTVAG